MSKNIDWANLGFGYIETDYRYVSRFKDGKWDDGAIITAANITLNECACVFQYSQSCFEGLKAYSKIFIPGNQLASFNSIVSLFKKPKSYKINSVFGKYL